MQPHPIPSFYFAALVFPQDPSARPVSWNSPPHNTECIQVSPLLVLGMARKTPEGVEIRGREGATDVSYPDLRPEQAEQGTEAVMGSK